MKKMLYRKFFPLLLLVIMGLTLVPAPGHAELVDRDSAVSVFRFQKKLAERGNPQAQYNLARMYEYGNGVDKDLVKALAWYRLAAAQNYTPAANHLTFLDIRNHGFKPKHQAWIRQLKKESDQGEGESILLLGRLYALGLGVDKDLHQSIRLLRKASAGNIPGAEAERLKVEAILNRQQAQRKAEAQRQKAAALEKQRQQEQRLAQQRQEQQAREERRKRLQEEKRQRELAAMEKQKKLLAEQQRKREQEKARLKAVMDATLKQQQEAQNAQAEDPRNQICSGRNRFAPGCR